MIRTIQQEIDLATLIEDTLTVTFTVEIIEDEGYEGDFIAREAYPVHVSKALDRAAVKFRAAIRAEIVRLIDDGQVLCDTARAVEPG